MVNYLVNLVLGLISGFCCRLIYTQLLIFTFWTPHLITRPINYPGTIRFVVNCQVVPFTGCMNWLTTVSDWCASFKFPIMLYFSWGANTTLSNHILSGTLSSLSMRHVLSSTSVTWYGQINIGANLCLGSFVSLYYFFKNTWEPMLTFSRGILNLS